MLFTSFNFIIFLVVLFFAYYILPKKLRKFQWVLLLIASYYFYYLAGFNNIIYIVVTTISTFLAGKKIFEIQGIQSQYIKENKKELSREEKKVYKGLMKKKQKKWLILCLLFNFGILAFVKYTNFVIYNINGFNAFLGSDNVLSFMDIALPMGISFYTFKSMSYIIDIFRGKYTPEENIFKFALYVSFFPQIVQGPISRYDNLSKSLYSEHAFDMHKISFGVQRIMWGFFKKLVLADRLLPGVNTIIHNPEQYDGGFVIVGMLFYAYELYADFTGGIDITIGIAQVFGIEVEENFNRPFLSRSITEFWRRWHMTMGGWFREYLFYPISASKPMLKLSKTCRKKFGENIGKRVPVYLSTMTVWFATGVWHGATWNFIVWGLMNGLVIIISLELKPFYEWFHSKFDVKDKLYFHVFQIIRTILLMSSIRMFDCYRDVPLTFKMFGTIFTTFNYGEIFGGELMSIGISGADYIILFLGLIMLFAVSIYQGKQSIRVFISSKPLIVRWLVFYVLLCIIIVFGAYGVGYDEAQFIYNQF